MERTEYMALLRDPRWQRLRLKIFDRDDWKCRWCGGVGDNLQVHHKKYERNRPPWDIAERFLITLCDPCHRRVTELTNETKEIVAEIPIDQLVLTVDFLKRSLGFGSNPLHLTLAYCDQARNEILTKPFTTDASRRLDAIDGIADGVWALLDNSTPLVGAG